MPRSASLLDVSASALSLYLSVWLYESGNWLSLAAFGANPTLIWGDFLPAGVAAVTSEGTSLAGAKLLQILICVGPTLLAFAKTGKQGLGLTRLTLRGLLAIYVTSGYWEMLSLTSFVPLVLHESVYIGLSIVTALALPKSISRASALLAKRVQSLLWVSWLIGKASSLRIGRSPGRLHHSGS